MPRSSKPALEPELDRVLLAGSRRSPRRAAAGGSPRPRRRRSRSRARGPRAGSVRRRGAAAPAPRGNTETLRSRGSRPSSVLTVPSISPIVGLGGPRRLRPGSRERRRPRPSVDHRAIDVRSSFARESAVAAGIGGPGFRRDRRRACAEQVAAEEQRRANAAANDRREGEGLFQDRSRTSSDCSRDQIATGALRSPLRAAARAAR